MTWLGALIAWCDRRWNSDAASFARRRVNGVATLVLLFAVAVSVGLAIAVGATKLVSAVAGLVVTALAASWLLAQRSLYTHVAAVAQALEQKGLLAGRKAVSMIVGRDPDRLDEPAVCRAAIESLAENFSDGVVAPLFWLVVGGLPGAAAYKAINTADSMIGHKTERHRAFGWAAARTDDLVNLPASRLAALWLIMAAAVSSVSSSSHGDPCGCPRRAFPSLAECRMAGSRNGRGARLEACRSTRLWRRNCRRSLHG